MDHLWDEDVKAFRAEFNTLSPQIHDSSDVTDDFEAVFSEFLGRKKSMAEKVRQVCYLYVNEISIHLFTPAYFSTPNSASHGRRPATQIVVPCYPMSRLNGSKSRSIYRIMLVGRKVDTRLWKY
jgi:hypothetical protein